MVGFDDFGAFGTSVLLAAEDCDPEGSGAAEEAEKGKQDEAGDNTNHDSSDGATRKTARIYSLCSSEGDVGASCDGSEEGDSSCRG